MLSMLTYPGSIVLYDAVIVSGERCAGPIARCLELDGGQSFRARVRVT